MTTIVAKGEGKLDLAIYSDPNAGTVTDELGIDPAAEEALRQGRIGGGLPVGDRVAVDHRHRLVALGVSHGVAQDQPTFGVGIENFDGLAGQAGDDVARSGGPPARHVLHRRNQTGHVERQLQFGAGAQRPQHAGRAAHVVFHLVHAFARLERDATGIEGHALADQYVGFMRRRPLPVIQTDQLGRLGATACHRQQRAHAQPFHVGLFQHLDPEGREFPRQRPGLFGQISWGAQIGGQIAQILGQLDAGADRDPLDHRLFAAR